MFSSLASHLLTGTGGSNQVLFIWVKFVDPANLMSMSDYLLDMPDISSMFRSKKRGPD